MGSIKCSILLLFVIIAFPKQGMEQPCNYPTYDINEAILTLKPDLNATKLLKISEAVMKYSKERNLDPLLVVAIIRQESHFELNIISRTSDYCMMQINISNVKSYKLNSKRLLSDYDYCVDWGTKILSTFKKKYGQKEKYWWSRYNSPTKDIRKGYESLVLTHYYAISPKPKRKLSKINKFTITFI